MTASVFIATSLDGFIARPDGALDWLPQPVEGGEDYGYAAFMASIDALVMGRKTFETVCSFGVWHYGNTPVFVRSRRALPDALPAGARVERVEGEPADIAADLATRGYTHLYVDGGETIRHFLAAGRIQRLIVTRVPVLLGAGIPLFGALPGDVAWTHVRTAAFASGLVQSEYALREPV